MVQLLLIARPLGLVEYTEWPGHCIWVHRWIVEEAGKDARFYLVRVIMNPEVVLREAVCSKVNDLRFETVQSNAFFTFLSENQRLALLQNQRRVRFGVFFSEYFESTVIENIAVLINFKERGSTMRIGPCEHVLEVFYVTVHRAGNEGRIASKRQCNRVHRMVQRPVWRGRCPLVLLRGRRILTFGQTINLVVEQEDVYIKIAAEQVHEMVSADGQGIAIARDDPNAEVRVRNLQA